MYKRSEYQILKNRLLEPRCFMQVVVGPRQVGKSTTIKQVINDLELPHLLYSADGIPEEQSEWISECWETARRLLKTELATEYILVFDEIQKIKRWSEIVKKEWDYDSMNDIPIKVAILGSSRVLLEKGLSDSMMGRYEEIRMGHWSYPEMRDAFGFSLEEYLYYGGYPGAASLIGDPERWENYILNSIIEATINKDILIDNPIYKPALLKQTFELAASYSSEILSLTKMVGQLQDAGNVTTIANYLNLLNQSGLIAPLQKYASDSARQRQSPPKYQVYNNALMTVMGDASFREALANPQIWGRIYESAIGAHIMNCAFKYNFNVFYWRDGKHEVDYVIKKKGKVAALEAKSNNEGVTDGMRQFDARFSPATNLIIGRSGLPLDKFLTLNPLSLMN